MLKRFFAFILCAVTVFGASPVAFANNCAVNTDYSYNKDGDYYYIDDKALVDDSMGRYDMEEKIDMCRLMMADSMNFMFDASGKKWLINMYKGQYGFIMVGSEVSVLVAEGEVDSYSDFTFADDSEMIDIQLEVLWDKGYDGVIDERVSTPCEKFRHANVMKKGQLTKYTSPNELETRVKFGFESEEFARRFVNAVKIKGFTEVHNISSLGGDTYFVDGATVSIGWKALNCSGYQGSAYITESSLALAPGESKTLSVKVNAITWNQPSNTWKSSDESVATVDKNGNVTAVSYGTARITNTGAGCCNACIVTVKDDSINYRIYETGEEFYSMFLKVIEWFCRINFYF